MDILRERQHLPDQGRERNYIRDFVLENYRWSRDHHETGWCATHYVIYQHYRNYVSPAIDPDTFHSNIGVGLAFPVIKILNANLASPWQAGDRLIDCIAEQAVGVDRAPLVEAFVNDQIINKIPRMFSKLCLTTESALLFGRGVLKPFVRHQPEMTMLKRMAVMLAQGLIPGGVQVGTRLGWERVPVQRRFEFDYVDPFDFWWIGSDRWFENCDMAFERGYMTTAEAVRRIDSREWLPETIVSQSGIGYDQYRRMRMDLSASPYDNVRARGMADMPHHHIVCQGSVETKKRRNGHPVFEQKIVEILDESVLVKDDRLATWNGKPGAIVWEPSLDPAGERGIGVIEPVEQILLTINSFLNIALDNARVILETPLLIDPRSTDQQELYLGPAEQNWVRNPLQSVRWLEPKELSRSFFELIGYLNDLFQRNTGVSDTLQGMNTQATQPMNATARGMEMLTQLSRNRHSPLLTSLDHELYRPVARWIHETAKLRMTDDAQEAIRLPGNPGSPFSSVGPEELDVILKYSFNVKALDAASGRRRQDFIEALGLVKDIAQGGGLQAEGYTLDLYEAVRIILEEFDRGAEAGKLVKRMQMPGLPMVPGEGPFATPGRPGMLPGMPQPPAGALPPPPATLPMPGAA